MDGADPGARGESASGLWASEAAIYGHFGFGIAAEADTLRANLRGVPVAEGRALDNIVSIEEAEAKTRPPQSGIDLFPNVEWDYAPVDSALPWLVSDPRRIDALWLGARFVALNPPRCHLAR